MSMSARVPPEMVDAVEHVLGQERLKRLDMRARRLEGASGALDRGADLRRRENAAAGLQHQADAQALDEAGSTAQSSFSYLRLE